MQAKPGQVWLNYNGTPYIVLALTEDNWGDMHAAWVAREDNKLIHGRTVSVWYWQDAKRKADLAPFRAQLVDLCKRAQVIGEDAKRRRYMSDEPGHPMYFNHEGNMYTEEGGY